MENRRIHLNSSITARNQYNQQKEELTSINYKVPTKIDANSKKSGRISNSFEKIPNSNRIHLNKENVRVIVRVRPIQDDNESSTSCISIINEEKMETKQIVLEDPRHRGLPKKYEFDDVYDTESTTEDIYSKEIKDFVNPLLSECSCINVFAFGSSGTGKTFTMHGNFGSEIGIVGLTIKQLIEINDRQVERGRFSFSFFEVYCEKIQDLLAGVDSLENSNKPIKSTKSDVSIRTDICGRIRIVGANSSEFKTWDEFNSAYKSALRRRASGKTAVNSNSSRSHACIQINYIPPSSNIVGNAEIGNEDTIENRRRRGSISFHVKPKINLNYPRTIVNLIDLSGFENNKITNNTGKRMAESTFINSSLLSLSKVINALKKNAGTQSTQSCIPYRESKLTRLLQEYLGGGADPPYSPYCLRCIMICTISPSVTFFQQTYATLNTPSYGNNSIMRKYIGIASSMASIDSRTNSKAINSSTLKAQKSKFNSSLNKTMNGKHIDLESVPSVAVYAGGKNLIKKTVVENLRQKSYYGNVESRVAQIIKGKVPLNPSKSKTSKDINSGVIQKDSSPSIRMNGCRTRKQNLKVNDSRHVGPIDTENTLTPGEATLDITNSKASDSNGVKTRNEVTETICPQGKNLVCSELQISYGSQPNKNEEYQSTDIPLENKSIQMNTNASGCENEINSKLNEHDSSSCVGLTEIRINRPITRSQTRKVS